MPVEVFESKFHNNYCYPFSDEQYCVVPCALIRDTHAHLAIGKSLQERYTHIRVRGMQCSCK